MDSLTPFIVAALVMEVPVTLNGTAWQCQDERWQNVSLIPDQQIAPRREYPHASGT